MLKKRMVDKRNLKRGVNTILYKVKDPITMYIYIYI